MDNDNLNRLFRTEWGTYSVGVDLGTMDRSSVVIIRQGDLDEVVASVSWEPGHISEAFLKLYLLGLDQRSTLHG